LLKNKSDQML